MKKLLLVLLFSAPTLSAPCSQIGEVAESIMTSRQNEMPISELMELADKLKTPSLKPLIIEAYKSPAYRAAGNKKNAIKKFRNQFELACYKERT